LTALDQLETSSPGVVSGTVWKKPAQKRSMLYHKCVLRIDEDTITFASTNPNRSDLTTLVRAEIQQIGILQADRMEFVIETKEGSQSHTFRVHTQAEFKRWCDAVERWQALPPAGLVVQRQSLCV